MPKVLLKHEFTDQEQPPHGTISLYYLYYEQTTFRETPLVLCMLRTETWNCLSEVVDTAVQDDTLT